MTSADIRRSFLAFFEGHEHRVVSSAPLVPGDDPTLLFTNAGMNQFKNVFLGQEKRSYQRATSSQKCMRVSGKHNDLDNVGPSLRHHTFFEMLGNFSFGDYFKTDAIPFAWQLLTEVWKIPPERLYATVFRGEAGIPRDEEAYAIWRQLAPAERIAELGLSENFWAMGDTGPCGRCSEIHYHRGDHLPCPEPSCRGIDCSCDRYVEIWNNVFMEFDRQTDGSLAPLPAPSIDTGMGLERIVAVLQGTLSNYDTDLFQPLLARIGTVTGVAYRPSDGSQTARDQNTSARVIADHMRAMTFLIADGVLPSNEWRGYVLRKIMRRAMRHGKKLGTTGPFLGDLVGTLVEQMGPAYPELPANRDSIVEVIRREEERFDAVLGEGLPRLEAALANAAASGSLVGEHIFRLYDTHGLPVDFIEDMASERGVSFDRAGFERALEGQRETSRAGQSFQRSTSQDFHYTSEPAKLALQQMQEVFEGYDTTTVDGATAVALFDASRTQVDELTEGVTGYVVLDRTPFYVESGGQVSDTGRLSVDDASAEASVDGMTRLAPGGPRVHCVTIRSGKLRPDARITAAVDSTARDATRRNHTATHLLQAALRGVLGNHVKQAGSLVAPNRLRFDFAHFEPLSSQQLTEIERRVSQNIYLNRPVDTEERSKDDAIAAGAMALFGEKYGDRVRVVSVPGISMELCGGTHCRATGDIGPFVITQESGVASGVRRVEALTGAGAVGHLQERRAVLDATLELLSVPEPQVLGALQRLQDANRSLSREVEQLKVKAAMGNMGGSHGPAEDEVTDAGGLKLVTRRVSDLDKPALRALSDSLRDRLGTAGVVVLASVRQGKVSILVSVTKDLAGTVHAGNLVKTLAPIVGGRGGGRPDFAEAGGQEPDKIPELFSEARKQVALMRTDAQANSEKAR